jgi:hypothetical protein
VFLAGSIEMGAAEDWQTRVAEALSDLDVVVLNPRRDAWDASWPQTVAFGPFREQVEWELEGQAHADVIAFYFAPDTRSPVTLLELGLAAAGQKRCVVCCPEGFWRKGNVDVVCRRYGLSQVGSLGDLVEMVRREIASLDGASRYAR